MGIEIFIQSATNEALLRAQQEIETQKSLRIVKQCCRLNLEIQKDALT